ncbi:MAG: prepilin-type N-terminal cleavage/methylation domain-containing protein, partial [Limisphaerales bacterium]
SLTVAPSQRRSAREQADTSVASTTNRSLTVAAQMGSAQRRPARQQADTNAGSTTNRSLTVAARMRDAQPRPARQQADTGVASTTNRSLTVAAQMGMAASNRKSNGAFTLVEILVTLVLLSLIVLALMAVFSGIQRAFRASLTQTDTLEGGRAVMDLIANDMENMTPSYGAFYAVYNPNTSPPLNTFGPVNFSAQSVAYSSPPSPLYQPLISSPTGRMRTNILENIFILSKDNINGVRSWIGTGYSVSTNLPDGTLYPLFRFYMTTNASSGFPGALDLYTNFVGCNYTNSTQWSHLMDGVVDLTARAYDTNGVWMTNGYTFPLSFHVQNVFVLGSTLGESQLWFGSNAVPASVQIEMGTLEDRALEHAEGLSGVNQSNYLANDAAQVHIFRRRVWIRNMDPTAYQQ